MMMTMTKQECQKIDEAVILLRTILFGEGWRRDSVFYAIKLLELAKHGRLMEGNYNPYAPDHLREMIKSGWLFDT
jgi:hypothetical protein